MSLCQIDITKDDTIVLDGAGTKADITDRCSMLREAITASTSDYEKEKMQERLGRVVFLGGNGFFLSDEHITCLKGLV